MDIVVKIDGGLGNQMSQYAMGVLLKYLYPKAKIQYDLSAFDKNSPHNGYELDKVFPNISLIEKSKRRYKRVLDKVFSKETIEIFQTYESGYPIDERIYSLNEKKNYYLVGTWHNYDYEPIRKRLLNDFSFLSVDDEHTIKNLEKIRNTNSVSIHVRRGDYCQLGLDIVGKEYYKKALDIIFSKVVEPQVFVFSDADVKDMFCDLKNINLNYITTNKKEKSFVDMYLMSECKHNIIANSTFSYWGAWINNNPEKIVIRPKMQTKDRETWKVQDWILL